MCPHNPGSGPRPIRPGLQPQGQPPSAKRRLHPSLLRPDTSDHSCHEDGALTGPFTYKPGFDALRTESQQTFPRPRRWSPAGPEDISYSAQSLDKRIIHDSANTMSLGMKKVPPPPTSFRSCLPRIITRLPSLGRGRPPLRNSRPAGFFTDRGARAPALTGVGEALLERVTSHRSVRQRRTVAVVGRVLKPPGKTEGKEPTCRKSG